MPAATRYRQRRALRRQREYLLNRVSMGRHRVVAAKVLHTPLQMMVVSIVRVMMLILIPIWMFLQSRH